MPKEKETRLGGTAMDVVMVVVVGDGDGEGVEQPSQNEN